MTERPSPTSNTDPPVPPEAVCAQAARAHMAVLFLGLGLPWTFRLSRHQEPFVAHHGRQATTVSGLWLFLLFVHIVLHFLISGTTRLQQWVDQGTPGTGDSFTLMFLGGLSLFNQLTICVVGVCVIVSALRMIPRTRQGSWGTYPIVGAYISSSGSERAVDAQSPDP